MFFFALHALGYLLFFGGLLLSLPWAAVTCYRGIRYGALPNVIPVWPIVALPVGFLLLAT